MPMGGSCTRMGRLTRAASRAKKNGRPSARDAVTCGGWVRADASAFWFNAAQLASARPHPADRQALPLQPPMDLRTVRTRTPRAPRRCSRAATAVLGFAWMPARTHPALSDLSQILRVGPRGRPRFGGDMRPAPCWVTGGMYIASCGFQGLEEDLFLTKCQGDYSAAGARRS